MKLPRLELLAPIGVSLGCLLATACTRARVTGGGAFSAADLNGHSGVLAGTDIAVGFNRIPWLGVSKDTPVVFHVMGEALLAEEVTDLSWGTGLGLMRHPDPVAGYALLGTSFHVDRIEGRYSVGSLSPYLELGVATPIDSANAAEARTVLTLGVGSMVFFNFLLPAEHAVTGYYALKFGLGYDGL
jgi:hypothetical protein